MEIANNSLGYSNFSKKQWQAMRKLANDRSIVIKKVDKGSCVVVWDRSDYIAEAEKQLSDQNVYRDVDFKDKICKIWQIVAINCFKISREKVVSLKRDLHILLLILKIY